MHYAVLAVLSDCYSPLLGRFLTRYSPVRHFPLLQLTEVSIRRFSFDLHVLSTPPAFILSQDQTLNKWYLNSLGCSNRFIEAIQMLQRIVLRAFPNNCLLERTSCPFLVLRVFVTLFNLQGAHRQPAGASYYHSPTIIVNTFFRFFNLFGVGSGQPRFSYPLQLLAFRTLLDPVAW